MDLSLLRLDPDAAIIDALRVLDSSAAQIVLVTERDGKLVGTVTDGDVRRGLLNGVGLETSVSRIMNQSPRILRPRDSAAAGRAAMLRFGVHHMPVVDDDGRVVNLRFLSDLRTGGFADIPVVLMAGGLGTRLRPLTEKTPKPLLMVGTKPILERILERFVDQGFRRFYISINYLGHLIEGYFGDGSKWDVSIEYLREDQSLGTGGALSLLPDGAGDPLIVMNGDLIAEADFREIVELHTEAHVAATMCVREHRTLVPFGVVDADGGLFKNVREKPTITQRINAGIYCLSERALSVIPKNEFYDMPSLFQDLVSRDERCGVHPLVAVPWVDIGTPAELERARKSFSEQDAVDASARASGSEISERGSAGRGARRIDA